MTRDLRVHLVKMEDQASPASRVLEVPLVMTVVLVQQVPQVLLVHLVHLQMHQPSGRTGVVGLQDQKDLTLFLVMIPVKSLHVSSKSQMEHRILMRRTPLKH